MNKTSQPLTRLVATFCHELSFKKIPQWAREDESCWILEGLTVPIAFLTILGPLSGLIAALINPQFQAIKLIIETLKGAK